MFKLLYFIKKAFTPITIMVIPHENMKSLSIKLPIAAIILSMLFCAVGSVQVFSLASKGLDYPLMAEKVNYYSRQFGEWNSTMMGLKKSEQDFQRLFALGSKEKVLENMETSFSGDIDWDSLKMEIERAVTEVNEIRDYLRVQKDVYQATPKGYPVSGPISSPYGMRQNPFGGRAHHAGVDISAREGTPIRASADGIVSFAGWTKGSGYVVVLEHGCGYSSIYAHNKRNQVKVGQRVVRGETIGLVGSTGNSTGPHLHYEVMQKGKNVNPKTFFARNS
ncbi:MAG: zinc metalloendopeptidase domain protein [Deltaproteobacteria bacterium]|nr:zinc metalloendopeptidase domain protein [Deltaproteobacteria bacterium]